MKQRDAGQIPAATQWHDGLLLEPQHFQESARRSERLLDYHLTQLSPFHYGFIRCEIDEKLLPMGLLRINRLEAVMPDGLVVSHPFRAKSDRRETQEVELDLKGKELMTLFESGPVTVHLAVASEDAAEGPGRDEVRYDTEATADAYDEMGGAKLEIPRLVPRLKLVVPEASSAPASAQVAMPIARIRRGARGGYEEDVYEPPRLAVTHDSLLYGLCGSEIIQPLRQKAGRLATTARALSESTLVEWQRKVRLKQQVHGLVAALPPLEALLDSGRAHPYSVYLALTAVVGQAAAASPDLIPESPTDRYPYRHDDLLATFQMLREVIGSVRDGILESFEAYTLAYGTGERRYQVEPPADWRSRHLAVCVRPRPGSEGIDVITWIREARMGMASRLADLPARRATGVARKPREQVADPMVKDLLREIVPPYGGLVFWLDRTSADLEGPGPFVIFNVGGDQVQGDLFELTLYVSHDPIAAARGPGAKAEG